MKVVQQRILELGSESAILNEKDRLLLCINGNKTDVLFSDLCESYKQYNDSIKIHSLFGEYPIVDNRIVISDDILISMWNNDRNEEVLFVNSKYPLIQMPDKKIYQEDIFIARLKEFLKEDEVSEEEKVEKELEELVEDEEINSYENDKELIIEEGMLEYVNGNYRLLLRTNDNPKAIVLEIDEDGNYRDIKFEVVEKNLKNNYLVLKLKNEFIATLSNDAFSVN